MSGTAVQQEVFYPLNCLIIPNKYEKNPLFHSKRKKKEVLFNCIQKIDIFYKIIANFKRVVSQSVTQLIKTTEVQSERMTFLMPE